MADTAIDVDVRVDVAMGLMAETADANARPCNTVVEVFEQLLGKYVSLGHVCYENASASEHGTGLSEQWNMAPDAQAKPDQAKSNKQSTLLTAFLAASAPPSRAKQIADGPTGSEPAAKTARADNKPEPTGIKPANPDGKGVRPGGRADGGGLGNPDQNGGGRRGGGKNDGKNKGDHGWGQWGKGKGKGKGGGKGSGDWNNDWSHSGGWGSGGWW